MSTSLYYRIIRNDLKHVGKCTQLKEILRDTGKTKLGSSDLDWLEGLRDAGVVGAVDLMAAVDSYGGIEVTEE